MLPPRKNQLAEYIAATAEFVAFCNANPNSTTYGPQEWDDYYRLNFAEKFKRSRCTDKEIIQWIDIQNSLGLSTIRTTY